MGWMPGTVREPVDSHSGPMDEHRGLVLHVQVGNGDCYGEFSNPNNQASSTWWIRKDGAIFQYVDSDLAAWTEAAGNFTWDSVETEGIPSEPLTDAQVQSLARIFVWGHQQYGWPLVLTDDPAVGGLGWHGMGGEAWGGHFGCPGDLRKAQRAAALFLAALTINPPKPAPAPLPAWETDMQFIATDPASGHLIGTDENGDFYGGNYSPPLVQVGLNQHPEWKAGEIESAGQNPCIAIVPEKDADGSWGYTYITAPTSGKGSWGPYNRYHINRNGTF